MAIVSLVTVLIGFGRSYTARLSAGPPMTALVLLHGAVFVGWMLFLVAQTSLVVARRTAVHRRLGWVGAALAGVMIVVGAVTAIAAARRGHGPGDLGGPLGFLTISLGDLMIFGMCVGAAVRWRGTPVIHKRLMLLGTVGGLVPAAIGRLPVIGGHTALLSVTVVLFLAAGPIFDRISRGRMHPVSLWGGLVVFLSVPVRIALGQTDAWRRFAAWLIQ
jgi:hypothetical protein